MENNQQLDCFKFPLKSELPEPELPNMNTRPGLTNGPTVINTNHLTFVQESL